MLPAPPGTSGPVTTSAEGPAEIAGLYREVAGRLADWSKGHVFAGAGSRADEGQFTAYGTRRPGTSTLLAADGNKIVHEEIFINDGDTARCEGLRRVAGT